MIAPKDTVRDLGVYVSGNRSWSPHIERYSIIHVWKIRNDMTPNDIGFEFQTMQRLGIKACVPPINRKSQMSVKAEYDKIFRVRAAQLCDLLPVELRAITELESFKVGFSRFMEHYPDKPHVPGYTPNRDNSLLSWRRTHTMPLS